MKLIIALTAVAFLAGCGKAPLVHYCKMVEKREDCTKQMGCVWHEQDQRCKAIS